MISQMCVYDGDATGKWFWNSKTKTPERFNLPALGVSALMDQSIDGPRGKERGAEYD
jgi:hypothetical protein